MPFENKYSVNSLRCRQKNKHISITKFIQTHNFASSVILEYKKLSGSSFCRDNEQRESVSSD